MRSEEQAGADRGRCTADRAEPPGEDALVAAEPEEFFTTPHYQGHSSVLVRLSAVDHEELTEILTDAWRVRAPVTLRKEFDAR